MWDRVAISKLSVKRGIEEKSLVWDTRVRDVLRAMREGDRIVYPPAGGSSARLQPRPERDTHALEAAALDEAETVRFQRRVDEIAARVARLELRAP
jgi:hypothetical protein